MFKEQVLGRKIKGVLRGAVEGRLHAEGDMEMKLEGRKPGVQRQDLRLEEREEEVLGGGEGEGGGR